MKNLILTALCIMFCTVLFSQELHRNNVTGGDGTPIPPPPPPYGNGSGYTGCDSCFTFDLSFSVTALIPESILSDITLTTTSLTGTVTGFNNESWEVDSIAGTGCKTYTYTQSLSICFTVDSTLCDPSQFTRVEDVTFQYLVDGECLAEVLNTDPQVDYFDQNCVGPNAATCDPTTFTFAYICCSEPQSPTKRGKTGMGAISTPKISPNPCIDHLNVENLEGGEEIVITSLDGRKLKTIQVIEESNEYRIHGLNDFPSGLNFLYVIRNGEIVTQLKFIKQ